MNFLDAIWQIPLFPALGAVMVLVGQALPPAKRPKLLVALVILLLFTSGPAVEAQNPKLPPPQFPVTTDQPSSPDQEAKAKLERDMAKKANQERQASLKRDTDKLLKLATELKEYVDKTNANTLSLDVVKKAEEIEKLARDIKNRSKG